MSFSFYPKQATLAKAEDAASSSYYSWKYNWIVSGLDLGVPVSGLQPTISNGTAWIAGYVVSIDTETLTVANNATSTVYLGLIRDGNNNVTGTSLTTSVHVSGDYVVLGTVTASGGNIGSVATTGRSFEDRMIGTGDLRDAAVVTDKLSDDAVTTDKLADDAVTVDKLADDAVTVDKISTTNSPVANDVLKYDGSEMIWGAAGGGWDEIKVKTVNESGTNFNDSVLRFDAIAGQTYAFEMNAAINPGSGGGSNVYFGPNLNSFFALTSAIQSDNKILLASYGSTFKGQSTFGVLRLDTNYTLDTSFNVGTGNTTQDIYTLHVQSDGKILVGGNITTWNGNTVYRLIRLNTNGSIDTSFNVGTGFDNAVSQVKTQADGKIIVRGSFTTFNGASVNRVIRLNSNGSIDSGFTVPINPQYYGFDIDTNGKIVVVYQHNWDSIGIMRLNTDGTQDTSFTTVTSSNGPATNVICLSDNSVIVTGDFTQFQNQSVTRIAKFNSDGTFNSTFRSNFGFGGINSTPSVLKKDSSDNIYIGGSFTSPRSRFVKCTSTGVIDSSYPQPSDGTINNILIQSDGKTIISGVNLISSIIYPSFVRINTNGTIDSTYSSITNSCVGQIEARITAVGGQMNTHVGWGHLDADLLSSKQISIGNPYTVNIKGIYTTTENTVVYFVYGGNQSSTLYKGSLLKVKNIT
jgi:uncharacterized delta-60 repeat protein